MRAAGTARRWKVNPVLAREITQRMRRRRAVIVLSVYLLILSLILIGLYKGAVASAVIRSCFEPGCVEVPNALALAAAGRPIFHWLLFFVLMLVCFVVPGVTSGAIAGERERQTLVPLQVTLLSPVSILLGKLLASLAFIVLLLVATLPLMGVAYAIGGVSFGEIVRGLGSVIVVAAALGFLSVACSAALRRVQAATVASYAAVFLLAIGTFIAFGMSYAIGRGESRPALALLVGNPFVLTADALGDGATWGSGMRSPFSGLNALIDGAGGNPNRTVPVPAAFPDQRFEDGGREPVVLEQQPEPAAPGFWGSVPFWAVTLVFYALLGVLSLRFAAGRIRAPSGRAG